MVTASSKAARQWLSIFKLSRRCGKAIESAFVHALLVLLSQIYSRSIILACEVVQNMAPSPTIPNNAGRLKSLNAESKAEPPKSYEPAQKRSFDYILKSGLAGGLAGCAVSAMLYCF